MLRLLRLPLAGLEQAGSIEARIWIPRATTCLVRAVVDIPLTAQQLGNGKRTTQRSHAIHRLPKEKIPTYHQATAPVQA